MLASSSTSRRSRARALISGCPCPQTARSNGDLHATPLRLPRGAAAASVVVGSSCGRGSGADAGHQQLLGGGGGAPVHRRRVLRPLDFDKDALQKFIEVSGFPTVVTFDTNPINQKYLLKYFDNDGRKAMLFLSFDDDRIEAFKSQFYEAAKQYGEKNISFLIGDVTDAQGAFQYFGLKESEVPLLFIQASTAKYIKPTVEPDQILLWLKEYTDDTLLPYVKSDPIPVVNDQPVKVVVADNLNDVVFNSGKNVLLEFYAPWCGHCQKLAPILDEVAASLQNDEDVIIAKMDATTNDIPLDFTVEAYPTMYFYSSGGNLLSYERGRTTEEIIDFIKKNKGSKLDEAAVEDDAAENDAMEEQVPAPTCTRVC